MSGRKRSHESSEPSVYTEPCPEEKRRGRTKLARVACNCCRSRKLRCDAKRPNCSRCTSLGVACEYVSANGEETWGMALRRENESLLRDNDALRQYIASLSQMVEPAITPGNTAAAAAVQSTPLSLRMAQAESYWPWEYGKTTQMLPQPSSFTNDLVPDLVSLNSASLEPLDNVQSVDRPDGSAEARALLEALATRSDEESTAMLCSLRLGNTWNAVLKSMPPIQPSKQRTVPQLTEAMHTFSDFGSDVASRDGTNTFTNLQSMYGSFSSSSPTTYLSPETSSSYPGSVVGRKESDFSPWLAPMFDKGAFLQKRSLAAEKRDRPQYAFVSSTVYAPSRGFGSLPFSSAIGANHFPTAVQEMQKHSLFAPTWQALPLSDIHAPGDPIAKAFMGLRFDIENGIDADYILGPHAYIAALDDIEVYDRAPKLSKIIAGLVKGIKPHEQESTMTMYALMWSFWTLFRWMLSPSPQTYEDIPHVYRPINRQMFATHLFVCDFVTSPTLRDYLCRTEFSDMEWLTIACDTIACDWPRHKMDALCRDGWTGEMDLTPICKTHAAQAVNWSMGPSLRQHLSNADSFYRIRALDVG